MFTWGLVSTATAIVLVHPHAPYAPAAGLIDHPGNAVHDLAWVLGSMAAWLSRWSRSGGQFLVSTAVHSIVACAICRAIVRPEERAFAYLRLGRAELLVWLLSLVVDLARLLPTALFYAVVGTPTPKSGSFLLVGLAYAAFGMVVPLVAAYPYVRLSLVGAMTVADNRFHLVKSVTMTRGRVWRLLGLAALVFGTTQALLFARGLVQIATGHYLPISGGLNDLLNHPTAPLVVSTLFDVPFSALLLVIETAPWARVYRDLGAAPDYAEVFA